MVEATTESEQIVEAYVNIWNEQEFSNIPDIVSDSFVMIEPAAPAEGIPGPEGEVHGRDGLEQWIREGKTGFPDLTVSLLEMLSREGVVMVEEKIKGTHEGEFDGIPPTGRTVELPAMSKYQIADGKVQEHRVYFDQQEFAEQLGLVEE